METCNDSFVIYAGTDNYKFYMFGLLKRLYFTWASSHTFKKKNNSNSATAGSYIRSRYTIIHKCYPYDIIKHSNSRFFCERRGFLWKRICLWCFLIYLLLPYNLLDFIYLTFLAVSLYEAAVCNVNIYMNEETCVCLCVCIMRGIQFKCAQPSHRHKEWRKGIKNWLSFIKNSLNVNTLPY